MKAMLACSEQPNVTTLDYPLYGSYKLDGIRCLAIKGKAYSRTMKLIPNLFIQAYFAEHNLDGLDGELMITGGFNKVSSGVMSVHGEPNFTYHVFDTTTIPDAFYSSRIDVLSKLFETSLSASARVVQHVNVRLYSYADVDDFYNRAVKAGYEGLILRHPDGKYKFGRSTLRQQWMLKLKPSEDTEGTIIAIEELMHNADTSSKRQENMYGGDTLGAFVVQLANGVKFSIGTGKGLDNAERKRLWNIRHTLIGEQITFTFAEYTEYGVPRFPSYKGLRNKVDITNE
jgi:DNA ligase-1